MASEETNVTELIRAFADAWNRHDIAALAGLFSEDAEFVNVVGLWWKGRAEIKVAHEYTHQTLFRNSHLSIGDVSVRFPVAVIAVVRCRWTLEGHVSPDGQPLPTRRGILVSLLQKREGRWSIVDSQNTDIIDGELSRPQ